MCKIFAHLVKVAVKSVLRIGSAHNKWGPFDMNIALISHLSNFELKLGFVFINDHSMPGQC